MINKNDMEHLGRRVGLGRIAAILPSTQHRETGELSGQALVPEAGRDAGKICTENS